jgi:arylsulfatase
MDKWELYHVDEDFSEAVDLAAEHPKKLRELQALFLAEAEKYLVTPLLGGMAQFFGFAPPTSGRTESIYYPGTRDVGAGMIPRIYNRSYTITADLDIPPAGAAGVIVAESDLMGGFSLYVQDSKLH